MKSTKNSFLITAISIIVLLGTARWAQAEDCEAKYQGLSDAQREEFNIAFDAWKPATATLPAHAFLVGCHDCSGAQYDATGTLLNPTTRKKIPTSWIMKVPKDCNGKALVLIPPGVADQVQVFNQFSALVSTLMNEGYIVAAMNHPGPGFPGIDYDSHIEPPYQTHDFRNGYVGTGHLLRDLMSEVFVEPVGFYASSASRGTSMGNGLLAGDAAAPFDGFVMATGGNGLLQTFMLRIEAYLSNPNRVPLTGLPPLETTPAAQVGNLVGPVGIGLADPEYRAFVLSGATVEQQLARVLAYNVANRPKEVQKAWGNLEWGAELKKPTIIFQGLRDRTVYPGGALTFVQRVVDAGASDLARFYLIKNMTHGGPADPPPNPQSLFISAVHNLDAWVQNGTEPGALDGAQFGLQPSCSSAERPFAEDPMGCFCSVMGNVDFTGKAIPECS